MPFRIASSLGNLTCYSAQYQNALQRGLCKNSTGGVIILFGTLILKYVILFKFFLNVKDNSDQRNNNNKNHMSHDDRGQSGHSSRHSGQHVVVPAPPVLNGQFVHVNILTANSKKKGEREDVGGRRAAASGGQSRREGGRRFSEVKIK